MDAAAKRSDLFSPKQCATITKHKANVDAHFRLNSVHESNKAAELDQLRAKQSEEEAKRDMLQSMFEAERKAQFDSIRESQAVANGYAAVATPPAHNLSTANNSHDPYTFLHNSNASTTHVDSCGFPHQERTADLSSSRSVAKKPPRPESPSYAPSEALQVFLGKQKECIQGKPDDFCHWLWILGIVCLDDLAAAVLNEDYLHEVLQQGNGKVGVRGFKRAAFKKAVMAAALNEDEVPDELLCPISHALLSHDPVVAADGHTYERIAIESWFQKQSAEIATTKQTFGSDSSQAREIIERGVLSPMTLSKMAHLNLTPNHVVRTLAKEFLPRERSEDGTSVLW